MTVEVKAFPEDWEKEIEEWINSNPPKNQLKHTFKELNEYCKVCGDTGESIPCKCNVQRFIEKMKPLCQE